MNLDALCLSYEFFQLAFLAIRERVDPPICMREFIAELVQDLETILYRRLNG